MTSAPSKILQNYPISDDSGAASRGLKMKVVTAAARIRGPTPTDDLRQNQEPATV